MYKSQFLVRLSDSKPRRSRGRGREAQCCMLDLDFSDHIPIVARHTIAMLHE